MWFFLASAMAAPPTRFPDRGAVVAAVLAEPSVRTVAVGVSLAEAGRLRGEAALAPLRLEAGWAPLATHMPGVDVRASWMLPAPAMRAAAGRAAGSAEQMAAADGDMAEVEVAARASRVFDEAWAVLQAAHVLDHHAGTLAEAQASVARRVAAGLLRADQRVMAQMEEVLLAEERLRWAARGRVAVAELDELGAVGAAADLRALLADGVARFESGADPVDLALPADPGPVLLGAAPASAPSVRAAEAQGGMAAAMGQMAAAEGRPMAGVMAGYSSMWADPEMALMVGVEVEVPLDMAAIRARRAGAEAQARAAEASLERERAGAAGEAARAAAMAEEAAAMERLMAERMLPLADERARLTRLGFEAGSGTLEVWLAAERELAHARLRTLEARAERRGAEAMVAMARGQRAGIPEESP